MVLMNAIYPRAATSILLDIIQGVPVSSTPYTREEMRAPEGIISDDCFIICILARPSNGCVRSSNPTIAGYHLRIN
jgi:hypothetical protein